MRFGLLSVHEIDGTLRSRTGISQKYFRGDAICLEIGHFGGTSDDGPAVLRSSAAAFREYAYLCCSQS